MLLGFHPFFQAYFQSDFFGRMIFWALLVISIITWVVLVQKWRRLFSVRELAEQFQKRFMSACKDPLSVEYRPAEKSEFGNPFYELYSVLRKQTVSILSKNKQEGDHHYLSASDVGFVEANLMTAVGYQAKALQQNLFVLSTIVSLAPFLGLLGTVWGILLTLSDLQSQGAGSNQMVLGGLSMALGTTVIGLIVAIPALIGHSYFKQAIQDFVVDMENFCSEMLAAVEMQYRKVDVG